MNSNKDNRATTQQSCWLVPELKQQQKNKKKAQNPKNKTEKQQTAKQKKTKPEEKEYVHPPDWHKVIKTHY